MFNVVDYINGFDNLFVVVKEYYVVILFVDIVGFMNFCEKVIVLEVIDFLCGYYDWFGNVVFFNDGMLDKYIGDGFMVIFGMFDFFESDCENVFRCVFDMIDVLN